jgi:hypothetical protein
MLFDNRSKNVSNFNLSTSSTSSPPLPFYHTLPCIHARAKIEASLITSCISVPHSFFAVRYYGKGYFFDEFQNEYNVSTVSSMNEATYIFFSYPPESLYSFKKRLESQMNQVKVFLPGENIWKLKQPQYVQVFPGLIFFFFFC